jgi:hypothetical protein
VVAVVSVLADDKLVDKHHKFHTLRTQYTLQLIIVTIIFTMQVLGKKLRREKGTYD